MKKIHIIILAAASFVAASCTQTRFVPTAATFEAANEQIAISLNKDGYRISGQSSNEKNEVTVTGHNYNKYTGYNNIVDNNYSNIDTYTFTSQDGQTVSYTTKYAYKNDINNEPCLKEMNLIECKVSNPEIFNKYCGSTGSINQTLEASRQSVEFLDIGSTTLTVTGLLTLCVLGLLFPKIDFYFRNH